MSRVLKKLFLVSGLILSIIVPARALEPLPVDPAVKKGTLPCGVTYYLVNNSVVKGYADAAVVRKNTIPSAQTRSQLSRIDGFLARAGVATPPEGLVSEVDGSTLFRFEQVPVYNPTVLDSLLLASFSLLAADRSAQAVILAGDFDVAEVKRKMDIFSMMVPPLYGGNSAIYDYVWEPSVAPSVVIRPGPGKVATVGVTYASARTPRRNMNTAQALVMDIFSRKFDVVVAHRLKRTFRKEGIPIADVRVLRVGSEATSGDEKYVIEVDAARENAVRVMRVVARTLAYLEAHGAMPEEYLEAKEVLRTPMHLMARREHTNRQWVNRCVSSYLYGSNLSPFSEELKLFSGKNLADSSDLKYFNNIADAVLDQNQNLTLSFKSPADSLDEDQLLFDYNLFYLMGSTELNRQGQDWSRKDTVALSSGIKKARIRSEKEDPVSGGILWTFSNGMRVVYRQMKGTGIFDYALYLPGGYAQVPDIAEGEGGFVGDLLGLYQISGMKGYDFQDMLIANGIRMKTTVTSREMVIKGSATRSKLPLLMKSLTALANDRMFDDEAFAYYSECEKLRLERDRNTFQGRERFLYKALVEDDMTVPYKDPDMLSSSIQVKADAYFNDRFSSMQDAVLVLAGDLDEKAVRRLLPRFIGGFFTSPESRIRRQVPPIRTASGTATYKVESPSPFVEVMMSAEFPMSLENRAAAVAAEDLVRAQVARELYGMAVSARVESRFEQYPNERVWLRISCSPVPLEGMGEEAAQADMQKALEAVRRAISKVAATAVPKAAVETAKKNAISEIERRTGRSEGVTELVLMRYSIGKDFVSRYKENIGALTPEKVSSLLKLLSEGGRVEYMAI